MFSCVEPRTQCRRFPNADLRNCSRRKIANFGGGDLPYPLQAPRVDPGRPSRTSPRTICPSVLASDAVKNVAVCIKRNDGAVSSFGEYGLSCGLHVSLCTLQLTCSVFTSAVAVATLGRSGWLILTPQGLSPCKKRQASLGALEFGHFKLRFLSKA